jgi:hypothetical protein
MPAPNLFLGLLVHLCELDVLLDVRSDPNGAGWKLYPCPMILKWELAGSGSLI